MATPQYCTREDVLAALDAGDVARNSRQLDRIVDGASRSIENLCQRVFYPETATRYWDWPDEQQGRSWRLWLDRNELISVTSVTSGGVALSDYFLEPQRYGPPYDRIDLDLSGDDAFGGGDTHQRDVTVVGVFGYRDDSATAGALAEALDTSETGVDVTDSASIGVGDLIKVGSERMIVTGKSSLTTAQTGTLTAAKNAETLAVSDGTAFTVGEVLLLDSERVRVLDIAGNSLTVERAVDGSTLAAHTTATIYAPRRLTVTRGAVGTTAAAHDTAAAITRWVPPGPVHDLAVAEVLVRLGREQSGYARTVGSGEGQRAAPGGDIRDMRAQVRSSHGRKGRLRVI